MENVQIGNILKISRLTLCWKWQKLWEHHLKELKLEHAEVFLDLKKLGNTGSPPSPSTPAQRSRSQPWYLDKLVLERGGLVMVGIGPTVPPLSLNVEGTFDDIPLGGNLSEIDLQKKRTIEFHNLYAHSSLDPTVSVFRIEDIILEFRLAGLRKHQLDSLVFQKPILDIDRSFFWFVDKLRKASTAQAISSNPNWTVHSFHIRNGKLDITRLHEFSLQYPFEFEVSRQDLNLRDLSLAQFQIELNIPKQDLSWEAMHIFLKNLHGKIAFNLEAPSPDPIPHGTDRRPANDLVNTLYADTIRWKELQITSSWLEITFDPDHITGMYGGAFAQGYINGGMECEWSGEDPWRLWGTASDVNTGEISHALNSEALTMNGRAELGFDVQGKQAECLGNLELKSLSSGIVQIRSLQYLLNHIQENTNGIKRGLMEAFVKSLKEYLYRNYALEVHYAKPDGSLHFYSEGDQGNRKLNLHWHGQK